MRGTDTQSRADAFIRKKRLISKSDYNLTSGIQTLDACKSILETEKTLKTLSSGRIYKKNKKKKTKNPTKKNQKNPLGWVFKKNRVFSNPDL